MWIDPRLAVLLMLTSGAIVEAACETEPSAVASSQAVVERFTVDGVETVRNVSGSEWGEVRLELIAEIGSEESEDYMFTMPSGIWATEEAVFVADFRLGLRSYTREGAFIRRYGRHGEGPGEYAELFSTAVLTDGRVVAHGFEKIVFYEQDGTLNEEWTIQPVAGGNTHQGGPFVITRDERIFLRVQHRESATSDFREAKEGYVQAGSTGWAGELLPVQRPVVDSSSVTVPCPNVPGECFLSIPHRPYGAVMLTPDMKWVSGSTDRYRLEIEDPDGSLMVIERFEQPVVLTPLERRYHEATIEATARRSVPGYELDMGLLPATKSAFTVLIGARDGRILVAREGSSRWNAQECGPFEEWVPPDTSNNCLEPRIFVDIFAKDGRYLGYFERPSDVRIQYGYFAGNEMWTYALGPDGNPLVRGYKLMAPTDS